MFFFMLHNHFYTSAILVTVYGAISNPPPVIMLRISVNILVMMMIDYSNDEKAILAVEFQ